MSGDDTPVVLSIVFVNYDSGRFLRRALGSLASVAPVVPYEAIVVDNASHDPDAVASACRESGARLLRLRRNAGYGAAANRGFRLARGRYLAVANPDIRFAHDALERLIDFMDRAPDVGAAGPQLVYPDGAPQPSARRYPRLRYVLVGRRSPLVRLFPRYGLGREFLYLEAGSRTEPVPVDAVIGTFMVFRREALESVAGFDERYFMFAEDVDICRRLHEQGWRVMLVPAARLEHFYGGVRRRFRRLTEFHRIKALCRFLGAGRAVPVRALIVLAGIGYLSLSEAAWLAGLQEHERSWVRGRAGR